MLRRWFERKALKGEGNRYTYLKYGYPKGLVMENFKVAKWGNSLAIRLPSKLVKKTGIKEGDSLPPEVFSYGALLRARLEAEREQNKLTREEAMASIRARRAWFAKDLKPEDWKIDRNDPDTRG
jgi:antitoxin MazE